MNTKHGAIGKQQSWRTTCRATYDVSRIPRTATSGRFWGAVLTDGIADGVSRQGPNVDFDGFFSLIAGCQAHHMVECVAQALGMGRTLIYNVTNFKYGGGESFQRLFQGISPRNCGVADLQSYPQLNGESNFLPRAQKLKFAPFQSRGQTNESKCLT